ncbi:MAG: tetratricopeptide repeat protein [bacterium]
MLSNDWKDWKTCIDDNLYVRLGLDPKRADSYTKSQIESAYEERKNWWKEKQTSNPLWREKKQLAEPNLLEALSTLTDEQKKADYNQKQREKKDKERQEKIAIFIEFSIYPPIKKDNVLTRNEEKIIMATGQEIGLSEIECKKLIDAALKAFGAIREPISTPISISVEHFKDNVRAALLDGQIKPKNREYLLELAKKHNISKIEAERIIDEYIREKEKEQRKKEEEEELKKKKWKKPHTVQRKPVLVDSSAKDKGKIVNVVKKCLIAVVLIILAIYLFRWFFNSPLYVAIVVTHDAKSKNVVDPGFIENQYDQPIIFNSDISLQQSVREYDTYYVLGNIYYHKGQYDKAIYSYTQTIEINRQDTDAYNNRGCSYYQKGKYDEAISDFNQSVTITTDSLGAKLACSPEKRIIVYQNMALTYKKGSRTAEEIEASKTATQYPSSSQETHITGQDAEPEFATLAKDFVPGYLNSFEVSQGVASKWKIGGRVKIGNQEFTITYILHDTIEVKERPDKTYAQGTAIYYYRQ